jgi:hypothetical protein
MNYEKTNLPVVGIDTTLDGVNPIRVPAHVVKLNTGEFVAVGFHTIVEKESGELTIIALAKVVNFAGKPVPGIEVSKFRHTTTEAELLNLGEEDRQAGVRKLINSCMMVVLGEEDTGPLWDHPIHAPALSKASIRTRLHSHDHAGLGKQPADLL